MDADGTPPMTGGDRDGAPALPVDAGRLLRGLRAAAAGAAGPAQFGERAASLLAGTFGDACILSVLSQDGEWLVPLGVEHHNGGARAFLRELVVGPVSAHEGVSARVVAGRRPVVVSHPPDELAARSRDDLGAYVRTFEVSAVAVYPLSAHGEIVGTLGIAREGRDASFTADERAALSDAARFLGETLVDARSEVAGDAGWTAPSTDEPFRHMFDTAVAGMVFATIDGRFLRVNAALCEMLGRTAQELLESTALDVTHPGDRTRMQRILREGADGGWRTHRYENRLVTADGRTVYVQVTSRVLRDDQGVARYFFCQYLDVTALRATEAALTQAERLGELGTWRYEPAADRMTWSPALHRLHGSDPETFEVTTRSVCEVVHPEDRPRVRQVLADAIVRGGPFAFQHRAVRQDGSVAVLETRGEAAPGPDGRAELIAASRDVTATVRHASERDGLSRALRLEREVVRTLLRTTPVEAALTPVLELVGEGLGWDAAALWRPDEERGDVLVAAATWRAPGARLDRFERATAALRPSAGSGAPGRVWSTGRAGWYDSVVADPEFLRADAARHDGVHTVCVVPMDADGVVVGVLELVSCRPRQYDSTTVECLTGLGAVIALHLTRNAGRPEAAEAPLHDPLTRLPRRVLLLDRLRHALARGVRSGAGPCVVAVDLDGLDRVNARLGRRAGDAVLQEAGRRVAAALRGADTVARTGPDEFAAICEGVRSPNELALVAARVAAALRRPYLLDGTEVPVTASIGIAPAASAEDRPDAVLAAAEDCLARAKRRGGATFELGDADAQRGALARLDLEQAMERALDGEFAVHYQPIAEVGTGRIVGVEALLRWRHPTSGMVLPGVFVPAAEESGLILAIGRWALEEACRTLAGWGRDLELAVNVSPRQLLDPTFGDTVRRALDAAGVPAHRLWLEVTETAAVQDPDRTVAALDALRRTGVRIALDDFGTGFSALGRLHHLPIDGLKVDRTFALALESGGEAAERVVRAITRLAGDLDLTATIEGIEDPALLGRLSSLGFSRVQGYAVNRPMPSDELERLLERADAAGGRAAS